MQVYSLLSIHEFHENRTHDLGIVSAMQNMKKNSISKSTEDHVSQCIL